MVASIATLAFTLGIAVLFRLARDGRSQTSKALWLPVAWLSLGGSRMVSEWLQMAPPSTADQYLEGSPLDRNVVTSMLAIGVLVLVARRQRLQAFAAANWPIILFYLYCGVSIFWSDYPDVALKRWIKTLGDLVMVTIVVTEANPTAAIKRVITRTAFLLIPLSILLIKYYPDLGRAYESWTWRLVYVGVTQNKNSLGMICMVLGVGCWWCLLQAFQSKNRYGWAIQIGNRDRWATMIAHGAVLAMSLWLLMIANSATSVVCLALGITVITLTSLIPIARQPAAVHFLTGTLQLGLISALFLDLGAGLLSGLQRDSTLTGRTVLWDQVLRMTVDPLFGAGYESFWLGTRLEDLWKIWWWHPRQAHNGYLETYLNLGWTGIILLAVVVIVGYARAVGAVYRREDTGSLRLAFIVVAIGYNLTEAAFKMMHPVWIFFLFAILAVPKVRVNQPSVPKVRVRKPSGAGLRIRGTPAIPNETRVTRREGSAEREGQRFHSKQ